MLDAVSLVHMNGRVYDPTLGRFLSADTVIQSLGSTASINPYAYAWNDPLRYTDPSGHSLWGDIIGLVAAVVAICLCQPELIPAFLGGEGVSLGAMTIGTAVFSGFVGGFVGSYVATGNLSAALTAGLVGAITAGAFYGIGNALQGDSSWVIAERTLAHAAVGCFSGVASGGNCGRGAISAAMSEAANSTVLHGAELAGWGIPERTALSGLIGGVSTRIAGGDFADGFTVAAAGYLYNSARHAPYAVQPGDVSAGQLIADRNSGAECWVGPEGSTYTVTSEVPSPPVPVGQPFWYPVSDDFGIGPSLGFENGGFTPSWGLSLDVTAHLDEVQIMRTDIYTVTTTYQEQPWVCTLPNNAGTETGYVPTQIAQSFPVFVRSTYQLWPLNGTASYKLPGPP
jgi:RHS repeat-associated protein